MGSATKSATKLLMVIAEEDDCWKSCFRRFYLKFGRYVECYAEIKKLWQKIDQITAERVPLVNLSLNFASPLTDQQLDDIESRLGRKLPNDLRCSYRICDGQSAEHVFGLFGGYDLHDSGDFLQSFGGGLGNLLEETKFFYDRKTNSSDSALFPFAGRKNHSGSLILGNHYFLAAYLTNESNSNPPNGSIVSLDILDKISMNCEFLNYAKSFKSFLKNFSEQLNDYPVHNDRILKFGFNSVGDTGPFQVVTRTVFVREDYRPEWKGKKYVYRYYITIKMDPRASVVDSCQLETRHYVITDSNGGVEVVDGPGVVGEFPIMKPGASHFWISGTSYTTPIGKMSGHFNMRNLKTGQPVQINCPVYDLIAPDRVRH